jgi:hypothetical protein
MQLNLLTKLNEIVSLHIRGREVNMNRESEEMEEKMIIHKCNVLSEYLHTGTE